jgi:hypothetical protein
MTKFFVEDIFATKKRTVNTSTLDVVRTAVLKTGTVRPHMITQTQQYVMMSVILKTHVRMRVIVAGTTTESNVPGCLE